MKVNSWKIYNQLLQSVWEEDQLLKNQNFKMNSLFKILKEEYLIMNQKLTPWKSNQLFRILKVNILNWSQKQMKMLKIN